ncbi:MAG: phosphotransferase-like protein [Acidimicrobiales bacterium]
MTGVLGMARLQAERAHVGVSCDIVVDTTAASSRDCADAIVAHLRACTPT